MMFFVVFLSISLITTIMIVFSSLLNGYVLSLLWGWILVPTFHLPAISVMEGIGIALIVGFLTYQDTTDLQKEKEQSEAKTFGRTLTILFIRPLIALLFGSVIRHFM